MDSCGCGVERRQFWLWRDAHGTLHASAFPPTSGTVRSVFAVNARDALLPLDGGVPKHAVQDADDPATSWDGRCTQVAVSA
jgi:hypothetical protein